MMIATGLRTTWLVVVASVTRNVLPGCLLWYLPRCDLCRIVPRPHRSGGARWSRASQLTSTELGIGQARGFQDEALAQTGVLITMYGSPSTWPVPRKVLAMALAGDGSGLLTLSDLYYERDPKTGHYSNQSAANAAINCLDHPNPVDSVAEVQAELPAYQQASPLIGTAFAWGDLTCAFWPVPPQSQPHPVHYAGSLAILVVGTVHDPATPYPAAQEMAQQLGSAVLPTYIGDGHTAYGRSSTCINTAVDTYLTQGRAPAMDTACQPDSGPPS